MSHRKNMVADQIKQLAKLFAVHTSDRNTLDRLAALAQDRGAWSKARELFEHIRHKTVKAQRHGDVALEAQYSFEEVCAKTLYNLTGQSAPYDTESPYWVVPNAFAIARHRGIDPKAIIAIVAI